MDKELIAAGLEERTLAMERGDFHQGVPAITVICDGGWSKRSHRHSYNAAGGVAVVIGAATKKLLHIGVRNTACCICSQAETLKITPKDHVCFKNWTQSSQAMEAHIILEGFLNCESKHGVRYMRFIGDGDSSVFARLQENVPVWGKAIQKLECANHCCKCLRSNMERLVADKPEYKGACGLTAKVRVRLVSAVRSAIKMRSAEADRGKAIAKLRKDIRNSIHHIFGDHRNCSSDFCTAIKCTATDSKSDPVTGVPSAPIEEIEEVSAMCEDQVSYWIEGTSTVDLGEARGPTNLPPSFLATSLLQDVTYYLNLVAEKAHRLLGNFTTNLAEKWIKFDG